jgi:hypothetical protein
MYDSKQAREFCARGSNSETVFELLTTVLSLTVDGIGRN